MPEEEQEPTLEELLEQLKDEYDQDVRKKAAETLGKLKETRAVEFLIAALQDEFPEVRWQVAETLGEICDKKAVDSLISILQNEEEVYRVKEEVVKSLGKLGDPIAIEPLVKEMLKGNEDSEVNWEAAIALGQLGEPALEPLLIALHHEDFDIRWRTEEALSILGKPAVEPLIMILQSENEDIEVRKSAASILGEIGDKQAIKPLIRAIKNPPWEVSRVSAKALEMLRDSSEIALFINLLQDRDENVRETAVKILGKLEDGKALEPLKKLLEKVDSSYDRKVIQAAIRQIERKVSPFGKEEEKKFILKIIDQLTNEGEDKFWDATNLTREYVNFSMMNTLLDEIELYEQQYEGIFGHFYNAYIYSNIDSKEIIKQIVKRYSEYLEDCLKKSEIADVGHWKVRIAIWKKHTKYLFD